MRSSSGLCPECGLIAPLRRLWATRRPWRGDAHSAVFRPLLRTRIRPSSMHHAITTRGTADPAMCKHETGTQNSLAKLSLAQWPDGFPSVFPGHPGRSQHWGRSWGFHASYRTRLPAPQLICCPSSTDTLSVASAARETSQRLISQALAPAWRSQRRLARFWQIRQHSSQTAAKDLAKRWASIQATRTSGAENRVMPLQPR